MAIRYVDSSLTGGTTSTYDPTAEAGSREAGGSDDGYQTFAAAHTAAVAGTDTIEIRGSTSESSPETIASGASRLTIKNLIVQNYAGEHVDYYQAAESGIWLLGNAGATINGRNDGGSLKLRSIAGLNNNAALQFSQSNVTCNDLEVVDDDGAGAGIAVRFVVVTAANIVFNRGKLRAGLYAIGTNSSGAGGDATFNSCDLADVNIVISEDMAVTFNNNALSGDNANHTQGCIQTDHANAVVVVNNPLTVLTGLAGPSTQWNFKNSNGSITVNGGVVNGNVTNPQLADIGVVTYNDVTQNQVVRFADGPDISIVALSITDSAFATGAGQADNVSSDAWMAVCQARGVAATWATDDAWSLLNGGINETKRQAMLRWIAGGMDLASAGNAGDQGTDANPFTFTYEGSDGKVGQLIVEDNGATVSLVSDGLTRKTYDTSKRRTTGGDVAMIGWALTGLVAQINSRNNEPSDVWTADINQAGGEGFDDTFSYTLKDGTYASGEDILFDATRRANEEVVGTNDDLEAALGVRPDIYYMDGNGTWPPEFGEAAIADGMEANVHAIAENVVSNNMGSISTYADVGGKVNEPNTGSGILGDGTQPEIEANARAFSTAVLQQGSFCSILFPNNTTAQAVTDEQIGWLIDELLASGVMVKSVAQAIAWIKANGSSVTTTETSTFLQKAGSAGVGTGAQSWGTAPRPTGLTGEPFSDMDTDAGPSQSTLSLLHPKNI